MSHVLEPAKSFPHLDSVAPDKTGAALKSYRVWDAGTRWFHWINALCVIALAVVGYLILNAKGLEIPNAGKITLKTVHTWFGCVFVLNLLWRLMWIRGQPLRALGACAPVRARLRSGPARIRRCPQGGATAPLPGHNPMGRLAVAVLLLLIVIQAVTGLVLAGTDIYYPPFGSWFAEWIAAPGVDPATLVPYSPQMYDAAALEAMRALRKPFAVVHLYSFYALVFMVVLHIAAVVITEVREGGSIVSAMFTGPKDCGRTPRGRERGSLGPDRFRVHPFRETRRCIWSSKPAVASCEAPPTGAWPHSRVCHTPRRPPVEKRWRGGLLSSCMCRATDDVSQLSRRSACRVQSASQRTKLPYESCRWEH